jgi:glycosyltransferase involved in cell wall biosynthesis
MRQHGLLPRILLTQRGEIERYPPVLHQARILDALGQVCVLDAGEQGQEDYFLTPATVDRCRVASPSPGKTGAVKRVRSFIAFRDQLRRHLRSRFDIAIAFEPDAAALLLGESGPVVPRRVIHLHEHLDLEGYGRSRVSRWAVGRVLKHVDRASLLIVPDRNRADHLVNVHGIERPILVVMNCPPLLESIPESRLVPYLRERGLDREQIVHYQGSVGPDHGLEAIIKSMPLWRGDALFTVIGDGVPGYIAKLMQLASDLGVLPRVLFLGRVPYDQVLSFAVGATLGVTVLDTSREMWRLAAGASNKRFEYAAIGVPQVTNSGPGMRELFEAPGIALLADSTSPEALAQRISVYLENRDARRAAGERARALHLVNYNYEYQYRPVLETLQLA